MNEHPEKNHQGLWGAKKANATGNVTYDLKIVNGGICFVRMVLLVRVKEWNELKRNGRRNELGAERRKNINYK